MTESSNLNSFLTGITINAVNGNSSGLTKLMINHGKPNFTVQRYVKSPNDNEVKPILVETPKKISNANRKDNVRRSSVSINENIEQVISSKKEQPSKAMETSICQENEQTKVVLRRPKTIEKIPKENDRDNIPEFIRRQRRIQERLAREDSLDFENRRSGYHIHCVITPTSPNRRSFVATMSSPAVVPSLEIPVVETEKLTEKQQDEQESVYERRVEGKTDYGNQTILYEKNVRADEKEAEAFEEANKYIKGENDGLELAPKYNNLVIHTEENNGTSEVTNKLAVEQHNELKQLVREITEQALTTALEKDVRFCPAFIRKHYKTNIYQEEINNSC